jgi:hypothetical protein
MCASTFLCDCGSYFARNMLICDRTSSGGSTRITLTVGLLPIEPRSHRRSVCPHHVTSMSHKSFFLILSQLVAARSSTHTPMDHYIEVRARRPIADTMVGSNWTIGRRSRSGPIGNPRQTGTKRRPRCGARPCRPARRRIIPTRLAAQSSGLMGQARFANSGAPKVSALAALRRDRDQL